MLYLVEIYQPAVTELTEECGDFVTAEDISRVYLSSITLQINNGLELG